MRSRLSWVNRLDRDCLPPGIRVLSVLSVLLFVQLSFSKEGTTKEGATKEGATKEGTTKDGTEQTLVLSGLRQELQSLRSGYVLITLSETSKDVSQILSKLNRKSEQAKLEKPGQAEIRYTFDFSDGGLGQIRIDSQSNNRATKYLRTLDFSASKTWTDKRTSHVITKLPPDAEHKHRFVFDVRCVGLSTMSNLLSHNFTLDRVLNYFASQSISIRHVSKNELLLEWRPSKTSEVTERLTLDTSHGLVPIKYALLTGNESPVLFESVETKWEHRSGCAVPKEFIVHAPTRESRMTFDWQLVNELPKSSPFNLKTFDITDRTLILDSRLNTPIVESVLNDTPKPQSKPLIAIQRSIWRRLLLLANVLLVTGIVILLVLRRSRAPKAEI